MKPPTSQRWLPLWINLGLLAIAIGIYAPFGLRGNFGLFEEFTTRYGYLRQSHATRLAAFWSFEVADWLAPDSFVGFNWLMVAMFWLKGALMVGLMRRLVPQSISLALAAGLLIILYPADSGFMTLRSISIHVGMVCALAATYGMLRFWQKSHWAWWLVIVPMQVLALAYEIIYPIFMLVPLIWLVRGIHRRAIRLTLAWATTPLILGLRAVWIIRTGEGGYVSNMVDRTTASDPLTLAIARDSLQTMIERHLMGWQDGLELITATPHGMLAMMVGLLGGVIVWAYYRTPSLQWRVYPIMAVFGLALMLAAFVLYLPTSFRSDTFRVNLITTIGATVALCAIMAGLAQAFGKWGRYWLAGWVSLLVMGGMAYQIDQAKHYHDLSANIEFLLGGIAAEAPTVTSDAVIVYVDRDYEYQVPMQLGGRSYIFEEAIQFIYDDQRLRGILCVLQPQKNRHSCTFTPDELLSIDDLGHEERLPYDRLIVLHKGYDGRVHLLTNLPPDYRPSYGMTPLAAYAPLQRVNREAAPPKRVFTAFRCWPLTDCLDFPPVPEPVNSVRFEMDSPPPGLGWDAYVTPPGVRWTTNTHATLHIHLANTDPLSVQFKVGYVLLPELLDGVRLAVNGVDIPLTRGTTDDGVILFSGVIPVEVLGQNPYGLAETLLVIQTDRVVSPKELGLGEDTRTLGLLIDWVAIGPVR